MTVQPDIVVVLSDQQRPDSCGVFGQQLEVTPVLDRLAADGVAFEESFTVQPLCGPARSVIQTGLMPTTTGCWRNGRSLPSGVVTLADRLAALGYRTGYIGKWHLASDGGYIPRRSAAATRFADRPVPPDRRGGYRDTWLASDSLEMTSGPYGGHVFDSGGEKVPLHGYRVDAITDLAIETLRRRDDDRPSLLFISYLEPHHQNNRFRTIGPRGWASRFTDYEIPPDLVGTLGDWRWNYAEYLACCASVDANLGRLVETLEASGSMDNTLLVYSSDHGSHFRTRNLEYKRTAHDASIRVPLVLRGPGFRGGRRNDSLVSNLDLVPTLLAAAEGDVGGERSGGSPFGNAADGGPRGIQPQGFALQRVLDGQAGRNAVLVQISESEVGRAIRTKSHTYAVRGRRFDPLGGYRHSSADRYRDHLLYDLSTDPAQRHNLSTRPESADLRFSLATKLVDEVERFEGVRPFIDHP